MFDAEEKISVSEQCKLLKINRNNIYYQPKSEAKENEEIIRLLKEQYVFTPFYGYRKMTVWLQKQGLLVNEKRVLRLMKKVRWQTIYKAPKTTVINKEHKKYPYLLKNLEITKKNQVWATDITYIPPDTESNCILVFIRIIVESCEILCFSSVSKPKIV